MSGSSEYFSGNFYIRGFLEADYGSRDTKLAAEPLQHWGTCGMVAVHHQLASRAEHFMTSETQLPALN